MKLKRLVVLVVVGVLFMAGGKTGVAHMAGIEDTELSILATGGCSTTFQKLSSKKAGTVTTISCTPSAASVTVTVRLQQRKTSNDPWANYGTHQTKTKTKTPGWIQSFEFSVDAGYQYRSYTVVAFDWGSDGGYSTSHFTGAISF